MKRISRRKFLVLGASGFCAIFISRSYFSFGNQPIVYSLDNADLTSELKSQIRMHNSNRRLLKVSKSLPLRDLIEQDLRNNKSTWLGADLVAFVQFV